jgi:hypothetical protein
MAKAALSDFSSLLTPCGEALKDWEMKHLRAGQCRVRFLRSFLFCAEIHNQINTAGKPLNICLRGTVQMPAADEFSPYNLSTVGAGHSAKIPCVG